MDPIEPFRAEFSRCGGTILRRWYWFGRREYWGSITILDGPNVCAYGNLDLSCLASGTRSIAVHRMDKQSQALCRAAKALQIAETQGPDAALLWKLSN